MRTYHYRGTGQSFPVTFNAAGWPQIDYNRSALILESVGDDYRKFAVNTVADDSPASEAGLRAGDTLIAMDGQQVSHFSLSELRFKLQNAKTCVLTVGRDGATLKIPLKLRNVI